VAELIDTFESKKGRPQVYPWESWTNGESWRLHHGEDFQANLISFRTMVHRKARDMGLKAYTKINEADASIQVRFYQV
jgi:hypothetical protein